MRPVPRTMTTQLSGSGICWSTSGVVADGVSSGPCRGNAGAAGARARRVSCIEAFGIAADFAGRSRLLKYPVHAKSSIRHISIKRSSKFMNNDRGSSVIIGAPVARCRGVSEITVRYLVQMAPVAVADNQ